MKERIICDKKLIERIIGILGKNAKTLTIQFDKQSRKAYYKTDTMPKKLPIDFSRVKDL